MSVLWKEVTSWLSEATKSAIKETEDLAKIGRLKLEILGINTALNDKFAALGGVIYELAKKGKLNETDSNTQIKKLIDEIASLETELRSHKGSKGKKTVSKKAAVKKKPTGKSSKRKVKPTGKKKTLPTSRSKIKKSKG